MLSGRSPRASSSSRPPKGELARWGLSSKVFEIFFCQLATRPVGNFLVFFMIIVFDVHFALLNSSCHLIWHLLLISTIDNQREKIILNIRKKKNTPCFLTRLSFLLIDRCSNVPPSSFLLLLNSAPTNVHYQNLHYRE